MPHKTARLPVSNQQYCPWWVPAFWRAKELEDAVILWELWHCEYYPGLCRVVAEMAGVFAGAESAALKQWEALSKR